MKLVRNALFNLVGGVVPAVASLLTVPVIVSRLGTEQYGVFALVSTVVGYFALFDINVTAGSVKYISEHHARDEHRETNEVMTFGALIYIIIGLLGALAISFSTEYLITKFFKVPQELHHTTQLALYWAAGGFLLGQVQAYLISIPQALQRYDIVGRLEAIFGSMVSISTLVVVLLGGGLVEIMMVRVILSIINNVVLLIVIKSIYPLAAFVKPTREVLKKVGSFSAFAYLNRMAAITFLEADKIMIGAMEGMKALSMYTVPFLLVNRLYGLIGRLGAVLLPAASAFAAQDKWDELKSAYLKSNRYVLYLNACILVFLCVGSRELLHYWAGKDFGAEASLILIILALALFLDSFTNIPSIVNDGLGTPHISGTFAVIRAALGLTAGFIGISTHGILGAAVAQLIVTVIQANSFIFYVHHVHGKKLGVRFSELIIKSWLPVLYLPLAIFAIGYYFGNREPLSILQSAGVLFLSGVLCAIYGWYVVIEPDDRDKLLKKLSPRRGEIN